GRAARCGRSAGLSAGERRLRAQAPGAARRPARISAYGGAAMRLLLALVLAYVPSATSLLKHTAGRAQALGRAREVTLSGVLFVSGEPQRNAQLVLRFPLQCRLDGEGGLSLSVKGTVENPGAVGDLSTPQLWLYKDNVAPARLIAQGGADLRLLQYGSPAAAEWFPRVIELWASGQLAARFEVLEAKGVRAATQEEEDDSRE